MRFRTDNPARLSPHIRNTANWPKTTSFPTIMGEAANTVTAVHQIHKVNHSHGNLPAPLCRQYFPYRRFPKASQLQRHFRDYPAELPGPGTFDSLHELDFYLQGGVFEPDRTLDLLATLAKDNEREGYRTMRLATDVSGLTAERVDVSLWEDFEGRLTQEVAGLPLVMVCQYDHRQVSGHMIVTAMRTHPSVILGDTFRRNPFYVPAGATASDGTQVV